MVWVRSEGKRKNRVDGRDSADTPDERNPPGGNRSRLTENELWVEALAPAAA